MANPNPPYSIPRIVEAKDPGSGHHTLFVRMHSELAAKFPNKAWGTAISAIGLPTHQSDQYPGYVLVDIQPVKGEADLYWIFEKLDGPEWTSKQNGQESLIPARFRRLVTMVKTEQEVDPATEPDAITGDLTLSKVDRFHDKGKSLKTNVEEVTVIGAGLSGKRRNEDCTVITSLEEIVAEGTEPDSGEFIYRSTVVPLGNGKSVKTTETIDKWPTPELKSKGNMTSSVVPRKFKTDVSVDSSSETLVLPGGVLPDVGVVPANSEITHRKVSECRYQKETKTETFTEASPVNGSVFGVWGVGALTESLVNDGDTADSAFGTQSSVVTPIGEGKAVKRTVTHGGVGPLIGTEVDPAYNIPITVTKTLVPAGTTGSATLGSVTEVKSLDHVHSIQIVSSIDGPPPDLTWEETTQFSYPGELQECGVIWDSHSEGGTSAGGVDNIATIIGDDLRWTVSAEAHVVGSVVGRPFHKISAGRTGSARVVVTRTFTSNPTATTSGIETISIQPAYGYITIHGAQANYKQVAQKAGVGPISTGFSSSSGNSYDSKMVVSSFGPVLHNNSVLSETGDPSTVYAEYVATGGSTPGGGIYPTAVARVDITGRASLELGESSGLIVSGSIISRKVSVRPWRFGYYAVETYTTYAV